MNFDGRIAELELARTADAGAAASSRVRHFFGDRRQQVFDAAAGPSEVHVHGDHVVVELHAGEQRAEAALRQARHDDADPLFDAALAATIQVGKCVLATEEADPT